MKKKDEQLEIVLEGRLLMESTQGVPEVPVDSKTLKALTKGDDDPLFIVQEVGIPVKSANNNVYDNNFVADLVDQINEKKPNAYQGHVPEFERSSKTPDAVAIWLGAVVQEAADGSKSAVAKAYVLPTQTNFKTYVKSAYTLGKNIATSIYGVANKVWDSTVDGFIVKDFVLESIDFVRDGSNGIDSKTLQLTQEMKGDDMEFKTVEELRKAAPELVSAIEKSAKDTVLQEMKQSGEAKTLESLQKDVTEVTGLLGVKSLAEAKTTIQEMKTANAEAAKAKVDSFIDSKVKETVKSGDMNAKIFSRLVVAEMKEHTEAEATRAIGVVSESEEGKSLLQEMRQTTTTINPNLKKDEGKATKMIVVEEIDDGQE